MKEKTIIHRFFLLFMMFVCSACFMTGCSTDEIVKMIYPIKYQEYVEQYAEEYNINKYLVYAVIKVESGFDPGASSNAGAKGLMQLMDDTATECNQKAEFGYSIPEDLFEPGKNIRLGCYYLSTLIESYGDVKLAVTAYNGGTGNVDKWLEDETLSDGQGGIETIPYEETQKYVEKVFNAFDTYNKLYNQNDEQELNEKDEGSINL